MRLKKRFFSFLFLIVIFTFLCSCGDGVKAMERLDTVSVRVSASNSARGFLQAIFEQDEELFSRCFPDGVYEESLGSSYYDELSSIVSDSGYVFLGTRSGAVRPLDDKDSELFRDFALRISSTHDIDSDKISDIQVVNTKTYLKVNDRNYSSDCYVIVYQYDNFWYAFELETLEDEE